ncbi:MAG: putative colanic acid biosynthesis acetyltransferase [Myxococcales bacterium]|nr:MAG: putative colanic acid biosynthesis acetyltransferase [Myxococcales bacterium]
MSFEVRSDQPSPHSLAHRLARLCWSIINQTAFRLIPKPFHGLRRALLCLFGAKIAKGAYVHSSVIVWAPWNLHMAKGSCLGPRVNCYNVDTIILDEYVTVSQGAHLCAASHDFTIPEFPLITAPIHLCKGVWIATEAFIAMGITVGENAVIGARSVVIHDMPPGMVCAGHPCKPIKERLAKLKAR